MRKWLAGAVAVFLVACAVPGSSFAAVTVKASGPIEQAFEQSFVLHSDAVGRDFQVNVFSPPGPPLSVRTPVIYALDAGYDLAGPALRAVLPDMQPALIVHIGYRPPDFSYRMHDLLFERGSDGLATQGGGGAAFARFLLDELKPWIEARFPADAQRSFLMGHSASGLFAAHVLADQPNRFAGYVLASPPFDFEPALLDRLAHARATPTVRVFVSVGGREPTQMIAGAQTAARALSKPGSGFVVESQVFEGLGHSESYLMLPLKAYPFLLPRTR